MKFKVYLRVAKTDGKPKVVANPKPNCMQLTTKGYKQDTVWPTVSFGLDLEIPDELFEQHEKIIGSIDLKAKEVTICEEIKVIKSQ